MRRIYQTSNTLLNQGYNLARIAINYGYQGMIDAYNSTYDFGKYNTIEYLDGNLPDIKNNLNLYGTKYQDLYFYGINSIVNELSVETPGFKWDEKQIQEKKAQYINKKKEYEQKINNRELIWARISELIKKENDTTYMNYPLAQGHIGNCYLICLLRGMLRFYPEKYHALFTCSYFDIGYHEVGLFGWEGNIGQRIPKKIKVFVDDIILYNIKDEANHFSRIESQDSHYISKYVLIEKAIAKFFRCYQNLYGRDLTPEVALFTLIGKEPDLLRVSDYMNYTLHKNLYDKLKSELGKRSIILCSTSSEKDNCFKKGFENNHVYTLIDAEEKEGPIFILTLENPKGSNKIFDFYKCQLRLVDNNRAYNQITMKEIENDIKDYNSSYKTFGLVKIDIENFTKCFLRIYFWRFPESN